MPPCRDLAVLSIGVSVPLALFFNGLCVSFMTCYHIHFVAFDRTFKREGRLLSNNAVAKNGGHFVDGSLIQFQFGGNLPIGKVQTHEVEAEHPNGEWLMMSGKDRTGQIVEGAVTHSAKVTLAVALCFIRSIFNDFGGVAVRTFDTVCPAKLANHLIAFGVVDQSVNVQSHRVDCLT